MPNTIILLCVNKKTSESQQSSPFWDEKPKVHFGMTSDRSILGCQVTGLFLQK